MFPGYIWPFEYRTLSGEKKIFLSVTMPNNHFHASHHRRISLQSGNRYNTSNPTDLESCTNDGGKLSLSATQDDVQKFLARGHRCDLIERWKKATISFWLPPRRDASLSRINRKHLHPSTSSSWWATDSSRQYRKKDDSLFWSNVEGWKNGVSRKKKLLGGGRFGAGGEGEWA